MLKGAMQELRVGRTDQLAVDIGPVITAQARDSIERHIAAMRNAGHTVEQTALGAETAHGTFVAPTLIEIDDIAELGSEVFGPVLHVLRFRSGGIDALVEAINATGYGLTFGLHTRLDDTIARVTQSVEAGNLYINRNIIGAVVGVQPFGGRGLSGTGPKAGGPLYLTKLVANPVAASVVAAADNPDLTAFVGWLEAQRDTAAISAVKAFAQSSQLGRETTLPGPVGERNLYALRPRGRIGLSAQTATGLRIQVGAVLATGNAAVVDTGAAMAALAGLPEAVNDRLVRAHDPLASDGLAAALVEGDAADVVAASQLLAARPGAIVTMQSATTENASRPNAYMLDWLLEEVSISINTTAAGGNASLMALA
ncbi:MAG TPA: aldehyde dehydrogenase family protein, partial [Polymorphobacter sp.]|nr:aldehyde dehydrogenase family protein [Polymorphobacter sp.]